MRIKIHSLLYSLIVLRNQVFAAFKSPARTVRYQFSHLILRAFILSCESHRQLWNSMRKKLFSIKSEVLPHQFAVKFGRGNMKVVLSILLVAIAQQAFAQDPRFILNVVQTEPDDTATFRCLATAITSRHALSKFARFHSFLELHPMST